MKIFEGKTYKILPLDEFKLCAGMQFPTADSDLGKAIVATADEALQSEIPQLYASEYRRFAQDGNRSEYEAAYFRRRVLLKQLLLGEIVADNNRYTDKIIDIAWLMLEESSWIIPAHNKYEYYMDPRQIATYPQLPRGYDGKVTFVDLFSAETGALLALIYHYLKDKMAAADTEIVGKRIQYAVNERVLTPFLRYDHMFWMGAEGEIPNNWNPWILSNVLLTMALTESESEKRQDVADKAICILDRFLDFYAPDGGCNEGPHYWGEAAAALFDTLEILDDLTGGKADVFSHPLIYNMMDYIRKVHLTDNCFANFADADPELYQDGFPNVIRMGARTNNAALTDFAAKLTPKLLSFYCDYGHNYRALKNVCTQLPEASSYCAAAFDYLPDLQLAVWRKGGFCVAIKGGHNDESHNHNDVGNVIVLCDGKPILIDIGVPTYTRDLFSNKRYTVFPIASEHHNLPQIGAFTQKAGAAFCADSFCADANGARVEYTSAYGEEDVHLCARELEICDDALTIREQVEATGEIVLRYYFAVCPQTEKPNVLLVNNVLITLPESATFEVKPVLLADQRIKDNWHTDTLYLLEVHCADTADLHMELRRQTSEV